MLLALREGIVTLNLGGPELALINPAPSDLLYEALIKDGTGKKTLSWWDWLTLPQDDLRMHGVDPAEREQHVFVSRAMPVYLARAVGMWGGWRSSAKLRDITGMTANAMSMYRKAHGVKSARTHGKEETVRQDGTSLTGQEISRHLIAQGVIVTVSEYLKLDDFGDDEHLVFVAAARDLGILPIEAKLYWRCAFYLQRVLGLQKRDVHGNIIEALDLDELEEAMGSNDEHKRAMRWEELDGFKIIDEYTV